MWNIFTGTWKFWYHVIWFVWQLNYRFKIILRIMRVRWAYARRLPVAQTGQSETIKFKFKYIEEVASSTNTVLPKKSPATQKLTQKLYAISDNDKDDVHWRHYETIICHLTWQGLNWPILISVAMTILHVLTLLAVTKWIVVCWLFLFIIVSYNIWKNSKWNHSLSHRLGQHPIG